MIEDVKSVSLDKVDFLVQIYDIPKGLVSEKIIQNIGDYVGK